MRAAATIALLGATAGCGLKPYILDGRVPDGAVSEASLDAPTDILDASTERSVSDTPAVMDASLAVPRQISPVSTSNVTSQMPGLTVQPPSAPSGVTVSVEIDVCSTPNCTTPMVLMATNGVATPSTALAPGAHFWRARASGSDGSQSAWTPWWEFFTSHENASHAAAYGTVLDVDFDGVADVVVGAEGAYVGGQPTGQVFVYSGARASQGIPQVVLQQPNDTNFGHAVASAGDVNGDGVGDLVVGSNIDSGLDGVAYIYLGSANASLPTTPSITLGADRPGGAGAQLGAAVRGVGDFDGDGYGDLLVGAPTSMPTGKAVLYYGGPNGPSDSGRRDVIPGISTSDSFGVSVAGGNFDGDAYADIAIGATNAYSATLGGGGAITVFHGTGHMVDVGARLDIFGMVANGYYGQAIEMADVNADGATDLLVADPSDSSGGQAMLYLGAVGNAVQTTTVSATPMPQDTGVSHGFAQSVALLPGINTDGTGYVAIGQPSAGTGVDAGSGTGEVDVYSWMGGALQTSPHVITVPTSGIGEMGFGFAIASAGDLTGDGAPELVVGASLFDSTGPGAAYVYSAPFQNAAFTFNEPTMQGSDFGTAVAMRVRLVRWRVRRG